MVPMTRAQANRGQEQEQEQGEQHLLITSKIRPNSTRLVYNLVPQRHEALELLHAARNAFENHSYQVMNVRITPFGAPVVVRRSRHGQILNQYKYMFRNGPFLGAEQGQDEVDYCVQKCFRWFDDFFFFNLIHTHTRVELKGRLAGRESLRGCVKNDPNNGPHGQLITLYRRNSDSLGLSEVEKTMKMKKILGTLLHEMVHCLFRIFACRCGRCGRLRPFMVGDRGHGFCWKGVADAVEQTARQEFDEELTLHCDDEAHGVMGFWEDVESST